MLRILVTLTCASLIPDVASACSCVSGQAPVVDVGDRDATIASKTPVSPPPLGLTYVPGQAFSVPADWRGVFAIGRVEEIRRVTGTAINAVTVEVLDGILNARTGAKMTLYTNKEGAACGYDFLQRRDYVIATNYFGSEESILLAGTPRGSQVVNHCGMTREVNTPEGYQALEEIREAIRRRNR